MNYVDKVKSLLNDELKMEDTKYGGLLDVYALLVFAKGEDCTNEDVHDAWSIWQSYEDKKHRSLIPFNELTKEVQDLDIPYRDAIIKIAKKLK